MRGQIGNEPALLVAHDGIDAHEVDARLEGRDWVPVPVREQSAWSNVAAPTPKLPIVRTATIKSPHRLGRISYKQSANVLNLFILKTLFRISVVFNIQLEQFQKFGVTITLLRSPKQRNHYSIAILCALSSSKICA